MILRPRLASSKKLQQGSATLVVLVLLGIVMVLIEVNFTHVKVLERDLNRLERQQQRHWTHAAISTNSPPHE